MKAIVVYPVKPHSMHLVKAEAFFPGWLNKLLTTRINGLENYAEMLCHLIEDKEAIKVYIEVAQEM